MQWLRSFNREKYQKAGKREHYYAPPHEPYGRVQLALEDTIEQIEGIFHCDKNKDIVFRRYTICGIAACVVYTEGMADRSTVNDFLLRQTMNTEMERPPVDQRIQKLVDGILPLGDICIEQEMDAVVLGIVSGKTALFVDGDDSAAMIETRGYEKRSVSPPSTETVTLGPNEGFTEALRTNISLVRRIIRVPDLVSEMVELGSQIKTTASILYIDSLTDKALLAEIKRRIDAIDALSVAGSGELLQWIEDSPNSLMPQILLTERPDRIASFLREGQVVIIVDGSPMVMAMPSTFFHMMHTSDDSFHRWQFGTMARIIRFVGLLLSVFLPGLYIAVISFHQELLPMELITAIAETHSLVPFPMIAEIILMNFSIEMINEAGNRIPSSLGASLSIFGALILGQAAVAANIVSPVLIIIVAFTSLGGFCIPEYSMGTACRILRYVLVIAGSIAGFTGVTIVTFVLFARLCSLESFGVPFMAPFAPKLRSNPDRFLRMPIWLHKMTPDFIKAKGRRRNA